MFGSGAKLVGLDLGLVHNGTGLFQQGGFIDLMAMGAENQYASLTGDKSFFETYKPKTRDFFGNLVEDKAAPLLVNEYSPTKEGGEFMRGLERDDIPFAIPELDTSVMTNGAGMMSPLSSIPVMKSASLRTQQYGFIVPGGYQ
jgi:hypothetical protein